MLFYQHFPYLCKKIEDMINVEENLREICRRKGLRLSDVADRMGSGQSNLIQSVKGNPKLSTLQDIARAINISVSELLTMRPDSAQGLVIIGGQTYQISKPAPTIVQMPVFDRYSTLRDEIKEFVRKAIKGGENTSKMGFVETLEVFSLTYDKGQDRFVLALCYADGKTLTIIYDKFEYCDWDKSKSEDDATWDLGAIYQDIINDIEDAVPSKLQQK